MVSKRSTRVLHKEHVPLFLLILFDFGLLVTAAAGQSSLFNFKPSIMDERVANNTPVDNARETGNESGAEQDPPLTPEADTIVATTSTSSTSTTPVYTPQTQVNLFNFDDWSRGAGLARKTTLLLRQQDLTTLQTLQLVSDSDFKELGITLGQRKLLVSQLQKLCASHGTPTASQTPASIPSHPATDSGQDNSRYGQQMAHGPNQQEPAILSVPIIQPGIANMAAPRSCTDADIASIRRQALLLNDAGKHLDTLLSKDSMDHTIVDSLHHGTFSGHNTTANTELGPVTGLGNDYVNKPAQYSYAYGQIDPRAILTTKATSRKAVHITLFISERARKKRQNRRKEIVLSHSSPESDRLVLKTDEDHPYARIAMEEWGAANCCLMNHLLLNQQLMRPDIEFYLAYTAKIYDMAELYEWYSILDYDYQYRELQAEHGFPWGTFAPHLDQRLVPRKQAGGPSKPYPQGQGYKGNSASLQQECRLFKASKGTYCPFGETCKYKHNMRPFPTNPPHPAAKGRHVEHFMQ